MTFNATILSLCAELDALHREMVEKDRELRRAIDIGSLTLEECHEFFDIVPVCPTRFKLVEQIMKLEGE